MATNCMVKTDDIGLLTSVTLAFQNGLEYHNSIFKRSLVMIWLHCVKIGELRSSNPEVYDSNQRTPPRWSAVWLV